MSIATRTAKSNSSRRSSQVRQSASSSLAPFSADPCCTTLLLLDTAYNYHLQNFHGISALTCLPFTPPVKFRAKARPHAKPKERKQLVQGLCHSCHKYIDMQGPKDTDVKVAEIYWWKHAQVCHRNAKVPQGIGGYFVENYWWERVCAVLEMVGGFEAEMRKLLAGNK